MSVSSLRQGSAARMCGYAVAGAFVLGLGANCGSPTRDNGTTTTVATTTIASTTTTSIPGLAGSIAVQNLPCIAPASGQVSCTFAASATGGQAPYTFSWRFTNPANNVVVNVNGPQVRPELGCNVASGAGTATFNLAIVLTVTPASGAPATTNGTQQIARAAGACGT